ncbi:transposase, partial [Streptomyces sp. NRRL F-6491]
MNVQVIADPHGKPLWASPALPGATHDLTAARTTGIIEALNTTGLTTRADRAHQAAGRHIRVPIRGRKLKRWQRRYNTTHAKI